MRDRAEILRVHGCAADLLDRYVRRSRDRIDHHAFERTLPQLAAQQPDQEFLLIASRTREQVLQRLRAPGGRARTANGSDVGKTPVDVADRERRRRRAAAFAGLAQGRITDAEAPLRDFAGQVMHGGVDLARLDGAQVRSNLPDLRQTGGRCTDAPRGGDEVCEQAHDGIVCPEFPRKRSNDFCRWSGCRSPSRPRGCWSGV
jgi:hypothetical protein